MIAGIVLFAFGLETTIGHPSQTLAHLPAVTLCGGVALYLLAHLAFLWRAGGRLWRRRSYGAILLLLAIPAAMAIPALAALGAVTTVCVAIVAGEAIGRREHRTLIREAERSLASTD